MRKQTKKEINKRHRKCLIANETRIRKMREVFSQLTVQDYLKICNRVTRELNRDSNEDRRAVNLRVLNRRSLTYKYAIEFVETIVV